MNWRARKPALFLQCGFIAFLFIFWTPGFGVQYLAWAGALVRWSQWQTVALLLRVERSVSVHEVYLVVARVPLVPGEFVRPRSALLAGVLAIPLGLACWISVGAVAHKLRIRLSESASASRLG